MERSSNKLKYLIAIILIISLYFYFKKPEDSNNPQNFPTPQASVIEVEKKDTPLIFEYPGKVSGFRAVELKAQTNGILIKKLYKEGDLVKEGDILFQIDPKPSIANLDRAKAELANAIANLKQQEENWNRMKILFEKKAASNSERDQAQAAYEQAQGNVAQARSSVSINSINLNYTNVSSPITGMASDEHLTEGNLINMGTTLTKVTQLDPVYVNFNYPENEYNELKKLVAEGKLTIAADNKLKASVKLGNDILPNKGIIDFTDSVIDPVTSSISARVTIENENQKLMPGQFVRLQIQDLNLKDSIVIPDKAIIPTPNGSIIYIVDDENKVAVKPITIGKLTDSGRIVMGLETGDKVIVDGIMKLKAGQEVKPNLISNK